MGSLTTMSGFMVISESNFLNPIHVYVEKGIAIVTGAIGQMCDAPIAKNHLKGML